MPFIPILHADAGLLAVNKPAGLPVLPDGYQPEAPYLRGLLEADWGRLWVVHRLDRQTSGVLLFARSAETHRTLNTAFEQHAVEKVYHALALGSPAWTEMTASQPLLPDGDRRHRTIVDARRGKPAVTRLRLLEQLGGAVLIEARPQTGRTHQVRAHLAALGCPLIGDPLYGGPPALLPSQVKPGYHCQTAECTLLGRVALHALSLSLAHPLTGAPLRLKAAYPKDFNGALRMLRKYGLR